MLRILFSKMGTVNKIYFTWFFIFFSLCSFGQNPLISIDVKDKNIRQVLLDIASQNQLDLIFNGSYFKEETVSYQANNEPLKKVLTNLLKPFNIDFKVAENEIILSKWRRVFGYISDKKSGEKLIGATIYDPQSDRGNYTNAYGFFTLEIPDESTFLMVDYLGYKTQRTTILENNEALQIELSPDSLATQLVFVHSEDQTVFDLQKSSEDLLKSDLQSVFATGGEPDVFQFLYSKPGIQSGADGLGGLHVRGGNTDQNLILFDGVKIFNPTHAFGLFSIFNSHLLKHAHFSTFRFHPKNGNRLSSVLDLRLKDGNLKKWNTEIGLSTVASQVSIEGPLVKDKTGILLSFRRSHLDPILKKITTNRKQTNTTIGFSNHYFYDINGKVHHRFGIKDRLYLSFYMGADSYRDDTDLIYDIGTVQANDILYNDLDWGNLVTALRWNHLFSDQLFSNATLSFSRFNYLNTNYAYQFLADELGNELQSQNEISSFISHISEVGFHYDFDYFPHSNHHISMGSHFHWTTYKPGAIYSSEEIENNTSFDEDAYTDAIDSFLENAYNSFEISGFLNDQWQIHPMLKFDFGIRYTLFNSLDRLDGQTINYHLFQANSSLIFQPIQTIALSISYDRMQQPLHLLSTSENGLPNDLWVPSTKLVQPKRSHQINFGLQVAKNKNFKWTWNNYYKKMDRLLRYSTGNTLPSLNGNFSRFWENEVSQGQGWSLGMEHEIFFQHKKTKGTFAYTLSTSQRQFSALNQGEKFPFEFDQPHVFSAHLFQEISSTFSLYLNWKFASGLPQTLYISDGPYKPLDSFYPPPSETLSSLNGYRIPNYHRLDFGVLLHFKKKWFKHDLVIGLQNAYNRKNSSYVYYQTDQIFPEDEGIKSKNLLPILPTFRYNLTFGK